MVYPLCFCEQKRYDYYMKNKMSLKDLLIDTVEQINHLEKAKELLFAMYLEADEYFGFDQGEDE